MYNPFSLYGKSVLITGSSSGIGRAIAIECSKMGAQLIICGRHQERLNNTLKSLSGKGHSMLPFDLVDTDKFAEVIENLPELNGIVAAAGIIKRLPLKFINETSIQNVIHTNLMSPVLFVKQLIKQKKLKESASVVFISSIASDFSSTGNIMYMASKGGLNSAAKGIAFEVARQRIRVNCILPGMIKTNLTTALSDQELDDDVKRYPLGRYGTPEEIGYAAVYLLSDASTWMTGTMLKIDGGVTLR